MIKKLFFLTIIIISTVNLYGYSYPNQVNIDKLTGEINGINQAHKQLHYKFLQEQQNGISYNRKQKYIELLNQLRDKSIALIKTRNYYIRDKKAYIDKKEADLKALWAAEDNGPSIASISQMQGKLKINVDLSKQKMRIYKGDELLYSWQVSTARDGYVTPAGSYKPYHTKLMHYSKLYDNSLMPYSVFFKDGYAIHGTEYVRSLGCKASHGCIRLRPSNAAKLYKMVKNDGYANTTISIDY